MFFRSSNASQKSEKKNVAEAGWLLQTDHASFIWPEPAPVGRAAEAPEHAKALTFCPAVIDHEVRLYQVACPFDLRLKVKFNDFEIITRSRSVPAAVSSRSDLERLAVALLRIEIPVPKPVRLLGV